MKNHLSGWINTVLGEVCSFKSGSGFKENYQGMRSGEHPFIKVSDLTLPGNEKYITDAHNWISGKALKELRAKLQPARATVFAKVGAALKLNRRRILIRPTAIDNNMMAAIPDETKLNNEFLYFFLLTQDLGRFSQEGAVPSVNQQHLAEINIGLPPLLEQCKIAKILFTWDKAIEMLEKLISNAQDQKRALMQRLLTGKCRFSEFKGEWKTVSLKDLLASGKVKGKIVPCNDERRGVPYIGSTSFFGQFGSYTESSKAVLCEPSDILILWDGEYAGKVAIGLRGAVSSTVVRLRVDQKLGNNRFVFYRILFDNPRIRAIREGSGIPHLPGDFEVWYLFSLPCTQEQSKIAENLDNAFEQEDILTRQLALLQRERKVLMQQLLTGKRRVKVEDVVHA